MATLFTPNFNLDLYTETDKPNLRDQYNAAMGKIDTELKTLADAGGGDPFKLVSIQDIDKTLVKGRVNLHANTSLMLLFLAITNISSHAYKVTQPIYDFPEGYRPSFLASTTIYTDGNTILTAQASTTNALNLIIPPNFQLELGDFWLEATLVFPRLQI